MFGRLLRQPLHWLEDFAPELIADDKEESSISNDMDNTQETPVVQDPYEPTILDVIVVKRMLNKAFNLPPELVDSIFDMAEYWPHTTTEIDYTQPGVQRRNAHGGRPSEDQFLIRTPPLGFTHSAYSSPSSIETPPNPTLLEAEFPPSAFQSLTSPRAVTSLIHPCRKIVFTFLSRDQGWGNTGRPGPYLDSWTWFEVGLERCNKSSSSGTSPSFDPTSLATLNPPIERNPETGETKFAFPLLPREDCKIQCNVTVSHEKREHTVVWSWSDDVKAPVDPVASKKKKSTTTTNEGADGNGDAWEDDSTGLEGSTADGEAASAEVFESPEVKALEDIGRGKATGDGEFVRNLKLGDVITVWAKARFGGWVNDVDRVKVDVYWAV